jgi:alkane 1-monooxygenase
MTLGPIRYCGPFVFALSIPAFYYGIGPFCPLLTIAALLLFLVGSEWISVRGAPAAPDDDKFEFRLLPFVYIPFHLAIIAWALEQSRHATPAGFAVLAFTVGTTTGIFGVLAAHELVHGTNRLGHLFAAAMLSAMLYRHFRIAHVLGHHRWAASERDPAAARLGEGFYRFLARTVAGRFLDVWRIEQKRIAMRRLPLWKNRLVEDGLIVAGLLLSIFALLSWRGLALFVAQGAVAIIVLELFNYVAHYGLVRRFYGGRLEPFGDHHSWNSSNVLANNMIFNMGRHADHHARPVAPYQTLEPECRAAELPFGYAGSILLALIPPLWHRVMDPEVQRLHTRSSNAPA